MMEVVSNEVTLERALVAMVAGTRPATSTVDVHEYLIGHFGVEPGSFLVHPHFPKYFLIIFRDFDTMIQVLHAQVSEGAVRFVFR